MVSWAFYDLEQKLTYKVAENNCAVIKVPPQYTSQCCPMCDHIERGNRDKKLHIFKCKSCGYTSNDDRIEAMNLHRMGINYLVSKQKVPDCFYAARRGLEEMLFQNTEILHTRVQNLSWLYLHSSLQVADENALIWYTVGKCYCPKN